MNGLIDSHVNLHAGAFDADREEVIARARAAGITTMITICDRMENAPAVLALAAAHDDIHASLGAHPHYASAHKDLTIEALLDAITDRVVGIGETGLDLHYTFSPLDDQIALFRTHIAAARRSGLPVIVHTREADAYTGAILEEEFAKGAFPILLHCYTSGLELAQRAYRLGAFISFSGIMTFKNAQDVRAIAQEAPLDRVILETDCPYLAPIPHRGRRCEPAMVRHVYEAFAQLRGLQADAMANQIFENVHRCFPRLAG